MKNFLLLSLKIAAIFLLSTNVFAANRNMVFYGLNFAEDSSYAYLGGVSALNGNIENDGVLARVSTGFGKYNYRAPALVDEKENGQVSSTDLMLGYQKYFSLGRATLYAGANYDDYRLHKGDSFNRVVGGKVGAKTQFELELNPVKQVSLNHISNYSSAYNSYWIFNSAAWNFSKFSFGPEITFLGNRAYNQQRIGGGFSKIKFLSMNLGLSGGYVKSSGLAGDDGAYTSLEISTRF